MLPVLFAAVLMMFQQPVTTNSSGVPPSGMMLIEKFVNLTSSPIQLCNDTGGIARTCYVEILIISIQAAAAQTITITNSAGDYILTNTQASFPAGGASVFAIPGGMKFTGGLLITCGNNASAQVYIRGWRLRGTNANP